jgi:hypothetical protein
MVCPSRRSRVRLPVWWLDVGQSSSKEVRTKNTMCCSSRRRGGREAGSDGKEKEDDEKVYYRRVGVAILERQYIALEEGDGKEKSRFAWIK